METNTIIEGDCLEVVKQIPNEFVHAIITDIPYGIGYDDWDVLHDNKNSALMGTSEAQKKAGNVFKHRGKPLNGWSEADRHISEEYQHFCESFANDWLRVLKPAATAFVFAGRRYQHRLILAMENAGFIFKDMIAWEKPSAPHRAQRLSVVYERRNDYANAEKWQGWRIGNLRPLFEPILWFMKPYKQGTTIADNVLQYQVGAWNNEEVRRINASCSNIFSTEQEGKGRVKLHPAQKPLGLIQLLIRAVTTENQIILDPFAGSGTTAIAAKLTNRQYIAIEQNHIYAQSAQQRIQQTQLQ